MADARYVTIVASRVPINKKNRPTYDEIMMKPMMKPMKTFKMFSSHDRVLGPRI